MIEKAIERVGYLLTILGVSELLTLLLFYTISALKGGTSHEWVDLVGIINVYPMAFKVSWVCIAALLAILNPVKH